MPGYPDGPATLGVRPEDIRVDDGSEAIRGKVYSSELLGDSTLLRYHEVLDLVRGDSRGSCCFTKAYGKYAEGTGSVLVQCGDVDAVYKRAREEGASDEQKVEALRELRLR